MPDTRGGYLLTRLALRARRSIRAGCYNSHGNNRDDATLRFTVTMLCQPGTPMLTLVDEEELLQRKSRRVPRPD